MSDGSDWTAEDVGSAFIVRARLDPPPFRGEPRLLIRLESLDDRVVQHFTSIDAALDGLRRMLAGVEARRA